MLNSLRPRERLHCLIFLVATTALVVVNLLAEPLYQVFLFDARNIYEQRVRRRAEKLSTSQKLVRLPGELIALYSELVDLDLGTVSLLGIYAVTWSDDLIVIDKIDKEVKLIYDRSRPLLRQEYLRSLTVRADKFYIFPSEKCTHYTVRFPNKENGEEVIELLSFEPSILLQPLTEKLEFLFWFAIYDVYLGNVERALEIVNLINKLRVCREDISNNYLGEFVARDIASTILRKIPNIPVGTYQRLAKSYPFSKDELVTTIATDALLKYFTDQSVSLDDPLSCRTDLFCLPSMKMYSRFIDWKRFKERIEILEKIERGFCQPIFQSVRSEPNLYRAFGSYLYWELTLKIVQARELATAAGRYPDTIPGIEKSTICNDLSYTYRALDNGKRMSIHLSELEKLKLPDDYWLRLTYETKHPIRGSKP